MYLSIFQRENHHQNERRDDTLKKMKHRPQKIMRILRFEFLQTQKTKPKPINLQTIARF